MSNYYGWGKLNGVAHTKKVHAMSGITSVSGSNFDYYQWLMQAAAEDGEQNDPSVVAPAGVSALQVVSPDDEAATTNVGTGSSTSLADQIQSAVSAALQSAEQSGSADLKGTIYNTLVAVLKNNGIDPKTFKPTNSTGQSSDTGGSQQPAPPVDSGTSSVLAQVLAALSGASASSDPLTQLTSSQDGSQGPADLLSLLPTSQNNGPTSGDLLSQSLTSQSNNQDLLGFLFDAGQ
jgi:hypothetical protein